MFHSFLCSHNQSAQSTSQGILFCPVMSDSVIPRTAAYQASLSRVQPKIQRYLLPNRRALEETRSQVSKATQKRKLGTFGLCHLSHFKRSKAVPTFRISTLRK
ncbi:unnamed protein product [Rangifer tarandus platyrhynchus]|uniref:Uncharacterized protein n=1 Tax=Rangifer tarandus platyrhynchus TaxID=3082113 RepID=A0AC59Y2W6_RANTA